MTIVRLERPEDTTLADWFAELRLWFDTNDCSPMLFTQVGGHFNIKFADDAHARLFASTFAKYGPSMRCTISDSGDVNEDVI
jgi:hypothetical protein